MLNIIADDCLSVFKKQVLIRVCAYQEASQSLVKSDGVRVYTGSQSEFVKVWQGGSLLSCQCLPEDSRSDILWRWIETKRYRDD